MTDLEEIKRRRTFAIISHPDAGKTTLTEKLLLYGGAIHLAGSVKARKTARYAVSDWMEIEKQRGISVTSSVLQFDYQGCRINILDTPGHADFSEDTYRTLMAVDSAVMVIDVAKGVEAQTKKLFKVCSDRGIPIFTFVNKIDHFGKNPFDLMADIEDVLGIRSCPMNWPIGVNGDYTGIYDRETEMCHIFIKDNAHGVKKLEVISGKIDDEAIVSQVGQEVLDALRDDLELLDEAGDPFDAEKVAKGELTPMFFGSAMTNFGVQPFLEKYLELAPPPEARKTLEGTIEPEDPAFSGFISRSRQIWTRSIMTVSLSCVSARASSRKASPSCIARAARCSVSPSRSSSSRRKDRRSRKPTRATSSVFSIPVSSVSAIPSARRSTRSPSLISRSSRRSFLPVCLRKAA